MKALFVLLILAAPAFAQDRIADKWFWVAESFRWSAAAADFGTTQAYLNVGRCTESSPVLGPHPSTARLYGESIPIEAGVSLLSYLFQRTLRHRSRTDRTAALVFIEGGVGAAHTLAAFHNRACL